MNLSSRDFARLFGAVFLLVGILGFIPGVTTNYSDMTFASHEGDTALLGIFDVNILHNVVHLAFGVLGLMAAKEAGLSRTYLLGGGIVYLVVWLYGIVVDLGSSANIINLNTADNWLHLGLSAGLIGAGVLAGRSVETPRTATA